MEEGEEDQRHTQDGERLMRSDRNGRRIKGWNQKREKDERVQTRVKTLIEQILCRGGILSENVLKKNLQIKLMMTLVRNNICSQ